ncbi:MAG TPA: cob(I)yrinic acid a,c-diamide adenosyltransferase [Dehalococcoidales bacterium]|nr:cob(I)yrinic acid a,c-diamide adenosyltransferase [Dehalococcoidales bacterium]
MADKKDRGLVQVYTGNGKGKTTAAMGAIARASGHGLRAFLVSFMKGSYKQGEYKSLSLLPGVKIAQFGLRKFTEPGDVKEEEKAQAAAALDAARKAVNSGDYDLVVMDEVNVALSYELIKLEDVLKLVKEKPANVHLILTGRYAPEKLIEAADLATEMVKIKHPYDEGIKARKGIEF